MDLSPVRTSKRGNSNQSSTNGNSTPVKKQRKQPSESPKKRTPKKEKSPQKEMEGVNELASSSEQTSIDFFTKWGYEIISRSCKTEYSKSHAAFEILGKRNGRNETIFLGRRKYSSHPSCSSFVSFLHTTSRINSFFSSEAKTARYCRGEEEEEWGGGVLQ